MLEIQCALRSFESLLQIKLTLNGGSEISRDLGFQVEWKKVADDDQYVLKSVEPDLTAAAVLQVRKNIKDDKKLPRHEKEKLLNNLE